MGITLSVCLIVRNEEKVLDRCLSNAIEFADELIVLDTGSEDSTVEIAKRYTDKVFYFPWVNDFAAARNASFEKATMDYIMWIDADYTVSPDNIEKIKHLKERELTQKLICAPFDNPLNGTVSLYTRIVKRGAGFIWEGTVHERQVYRGEEPLTDNDILTADFVLNHSNLGPETYHRNIALMEEYCRPEEFDNFWFCAQCFLDCVLAGETKKANKYLTLAEASKYPDFKERVSCFRLINQVLKHHNKTIELIKWNGLYLKQKQEGNRLC